MGLIKDFNAFRKIKSTYNLDTLTARDFQRVFDGWFNVDANDKKYVGAVYSAIDTHGLYYAKAKFRIYDESNPDSITEVKEPKIRLLFENPNPYQTWWEFAYKIAAHFGLFGEAFFYKLRNGKEIVGYQMLLPSLVKRKRDNGSKNLFDYYEYNNKPIRKIDVIDLRYPNPDKDLEGFPIVGAIADTVTVNQLQMEYSKKALEKGGYLGLTFATDQELNSNNFDGLLKKLEQRYGGSENAFRVALLSHGLKPLAPPYSPKDMEFGQNKNITREEIFSAFKVPKILVGIGESVNRATADASIYQFTSGVIDPVLSYVDAVLTRDFKMEFGNQYRVEHDTLAPKDVDAQLKYYKDLNAIGAITINEVRAYEGENKFDYELADVPMINVGGAVIRLDTGKQISVEDGESVKPEPQKNFTKSIDELELRWKQFDRRHALALRRFERNLGRYFDDQERRILEAVLNNYIVEQAFNLEEENLILYQLLEIDLWDIMKQGYKYGDGVYGAGAFGETPLLNDFNELSRNTLLINSTTLDDLKGIDNETDLKKAYKSIKEERLDKIAVTTVTGAFNAGLLQAMRDAGLTKKTWLTMRDAKVRDAHKLMDGVTVPIEEPFEVEARGVKYLGMFPGDPLLGAVNNANDRCTIIGEQ